MRWGPPEHTNGPLVGYKVYAFYRTADGFPGNQSWNTSADNEGGKFTMVCPDDVADHLEVNYTVSAITYSDAAKEHLIGPYVTPESKPMCKPTSEYGTLLLLV